MRSYGSSKSTPAACLAKWCFRTLLCVVSVGLMALAGGAAASKSSQANSPASISALAQAHSSAGNLVPVW